MKEATQPVGVTQTVFAHTMGVDRSAVVRWKVLGLPMVGPTTVNLVAGAAWVRKTIDDYKIRGSIGAAQMKVAHERRWELRLARQLHFGLEDAAETAADLLLPLLPEATAREVVTALYDRLAEETVQYLAEWIAPPEGEQSWRAQARGWLSDARWAEWVAAASEKRQA